MRGRFMISMLLFSLLSWQEAMWSWEDARSRAIALFVGGSDSQKRVAWWSPLSLFA
jgi:hypothetical protein